jgi:hypothetical protein
MGRKSGHKKPFLRKPSNGGFKYKWGPINDLPKDINARNAKRKKKSKKVKLCNASAGSQGEDLVVTYTYQHTLETDGEHKYAYVACDYVV